MHGHDRQRGRLGRALLAVGVGGAGQVGELRSVGEAGERPADARADGTDVGDAQGEVVDLGADQDARRHRADRRRRRGVAVEPEDVLEGGRPAGHAAVDVGQVGPQAELEHEVRRRRGPDDGVVAIRLSPVAVGHVHHLGAGRRCGHQTGSARQGGEERLGRAVHSCSEGREARGTRRRRSRRTMIPTAARALKPSKGHTGSAPPPTLQLPQPLTQPGPPWEQ